MKQTPILENVYGRIDVVDLDKSNGAFIRVASVFMLGEASKYVTDLKSFNTKNKKLVEAIGIKTVKALMFNTEIKGGDEWDELDEMDFEELLNT